MRFLFLIPLLIQIPTPAMADGLCMLDTDYCFGRSSNRSAAPSTSSRINLNPSAVPTEKSFGVEVIGYKGEGDLGIVRGFGRVGAALTPSNNEETFFGAPSFEPVDEFLARKIKADKYENQKFTLATAFNLYDAGRTGLRQASLNLGILGKYNTETEATTPGGGLSAILGPFILGYSVYRDETLLPSSDPAFKPKVQSIVETYSLGVYLNSLIIDYSTLQIQNYETMYVELLTASLFVKKFVLTASQRTEHSNRPGFNFRTKELEFEKRQVEYFYGAQYRITKNFMVGALYNYYLMREASVSATLLF